MAWETRSTSFNCRSRDDRIYRVTELSRYLKSAALDSSDWVQTSQEFSLSPTGEHVKKIDENTFEIVAIGKIIRKL